MPAAEKDQSADQTQTWYDVWQAQGRSPPWSRPTGRRAATPAGPDPAGDPFGRAPDHLGSWPATAAAICLLLCVISLVFLAVARADHRYLLRHGVVAEATVVEPTRCGRRLCYFQVQYVTPAGPHTATVPAARPERLQPGATVTIRYDPADPGRVERVDNTDEQYFTFMAALFGTLGVALLLLALLRAATAA